MPIVTVWYCAGLCEFGGSETYQIQESYALFLKRTKIRATEGGAVAVAALELITPALICKLLRSKLMSMHYAQVRKSDMRIVLMLLVDYGRCLQQSFGQV